MAALVMFSAAAVLLCLLLPSSMADNVLYGGHILKSGKSLTEGDNEFIMQSDCKLVLCNNGQEVWSSGTKDRGTRCFVRLQNDGDLVLFDDDLNIIWESQTSGMKGMYVLVLQRDGRVVINGSPTWIVPEHEPTNRKIAMHGD